MLCRKLTAKALSSAVVTWSFSCLAEERDSAAPASTITDHRCLARDTAFLGRGCWGSGTPSLMLASFSLSLQSLCYIVTAISHVIMLITALQMIMILASCLPVTISAAVSAVT